LNCGKELPRQKKVLSRFLYLHNRRNIIPSPVGHTLAGASILLASGKKTQKFSFSQWGIVFLLANLQDIDYLFGYVVGNPNKYHHLWTHSLTFAVGTGVISGFVYWIVVQKESFRFGCIAFFLVFSHLVLDFFTRDTMYPYGMKLFWPFSQKFFISPVVLFLDVNKASSSYAFVRSLFCWHNFWTVLVELIILGPAFIWLWLRKRQKLKELT